MNEELKPCPFCGSQNVKAFAYGQTIGGEPDAFCQCQDCSTTGPNGKDDAEAIVAWNRRATPPSPSTAPIAKGEREAFDKALAASFPDMPAREDGGAQNAKFIAFAMFQAGIAHARALASRPAAEVGELMILTYYYDIDGSLRLKGREFEYGSVGEYVRLQDARAYGQECARAAEARCKVSADAAIELAGDTINARNAEIAELRAALAANTAKEESQ